MTDQQRVEQILKLNAKKAHGHIDSAVQHVDELLSIIQRQAQRERELREALETIAGHKGKCLLGPQRGPDY